MIYHYLQNQLDKPWLRRVILVVLVTLMGLQLLQLLSALHYQTPLTKAGVTRLTQTLSAPVSLASDLQLFGRDTTTALPIARLNLRLRGILTGETPQAVIASAQGQDKLYQPGDSLPGGARLIRILPKSVIITYNGQNARLILPQKPLQLNVNISRRS